MICVGCWLCYPSPPLGYITGTFKDKIILFMGWNIKLKLLCRGRKWAPNKMQDLVLWEKHLRCLRCFIRFGLKAKCFVRKAKFRWQQGESPAQSHLCQLWRTHLAPVTQTEKAGLWLRAKDTTVRAQLWLNVCSSVTGETHTESREEKSGRKANFHTAHTP